MSQICTEMYCLITMVIRKPQHVEFVMEVDKLLFINS